MHVVVQARRPVGKAVRIMAEITCYRPMNNFNPTDGLDSSCSINALCMDRYQPWELGDATRSFMNNSSTMEQQQQHHESFDSWVPAGPKLMQSEFKEPKSVLDLQTSSLSSQHSFNSVSDCTSTALQTVTDQLLSDEEDSAFLQRRQGANRTTCLWIRISSLGWSSCSPSQGKLIKRVTTTLVRTWTLILVQ